MKSRLFGRILTPALHLVSGAFFLICTSQSASAITVSYVPSTQVVSIGDTVQIDIVVSDPDLGGTLVIGEFSIGSRFDTTILADKTELMPTTAVFHGHLGIPGTDTTAIWGVFEADAVDVVETTENAITTNIDTLRALQSPTFTLATVYFEALAAGTSVIEFTNGSQGSVFLGGVTGGSLAFTTTGNASITVVPIPPVLYLFGSGLIGLVGMARRNENTPYG